jgi:hypothetical protein
VVIDRPMTPSQARGLGFIEKMNVGMVPRLRESVLPLYGYAREHDHLRLLGTASLVAIAGRYFIITASHVVQAVYDSGRQRDDLFVANLFNGAFVSIQGALTGDKSDKHDFAFIEVEQSVVDMLEGHRFLSLADIDLSTGACSPGWYYIHGYPEVGAGFDPRSQTHGATPFTHSTALYAGDTSFLPTYIPHEHILLDYEPGGTVDSLGKDARPPSDLRGISGSPIWRSFAYGDDARTWTSADARVVALETAVVRRADRLIVRGTRWFVVLALMKRVYPDLSPAIALHDPPPVSLRIRD